RRATARMDGTADRSAEGSRGRSRQGGVPVIDLKTMPINGHPQDFSEDAKTVAGWLRLLHGDSAAVEFRALKCTTSRGGRETTRCGFFDPDHFEEMAKAGLDLTRTVASGVYMTLNGLDPAILARRHNREDYAGAGDTSSDANVVRRTLMLIDIDPKRLAG